MIGYLIKNNFKIMRRSMLNILLFVLAPTIIAAVLISSFTNLMKSYEAPESFEVGYRIEGDSPYAAYMEAFRDGLKKEGITLTEYRDGKVEELVTGKELGAFIEFKKDSYTLYKNGDERTQGQIIEYILGEMMEGSRAATTDVKPSTINVEHPFFVPAVNSTDYYGIIEIVYFAWCSIICGAGVFSAEKKAKIGKRFEMIGVPEWKLYIARLVPIVTAVSLGLLGSALIGIFLLNVHWGNALLSMLVMLVMIIAATSFEMAIYYATQSMVATVVGTFSIVWFFGFFGGSFETYMFASHPQFIKNLSPVYYSNRALVELSCMGHSDYVVKSIVISLIIMAVCSAICIGIGRIRRGRS